MAVISIAARVAIWLTIILTITLMTIMPVIITNAIITITFTMTSIAIIPVMSIRHIYY